VLAFSVLKEIEGQVWVRVSAFHVQDHLSLRLTGFPQSSGGKVQSSESRLRSWVRKAEEVQLMAKHIIPESPRGRAINRWPPVSISVSPFTPGAKQKK
jgi:hypothetical protein